MFLVKYKPDALLQFSHTLCFVSHFSAKILASHFKFSSSLSLTLQLIALNNIDPLYCSSVLEYIVGRIKLSENVVEHVVFASMFNKKM